MSYISKTEITEGELFRSNRTKEVVLAGARAKCTVITHLHPYIQKKLDLQSATTVI